METQFYNGYKHGKGVRTYSNNNKVQGNFVFDVIEGETNYTFANGDVYCGNIYNDRFNGYGIFTTAKGERYEGSFLKVIHL